jgi:very-short-patch-repair endonuclease
MNPKNKLNKESFVCKANLIHENKYDYSLVEYINSHIKVKIICPEHGVFLQTPGKHLIKQGCPTCGNYKLKISQRSNKDEFVSKAQLIHGNKYDYKDVVYVNSKTKVKIICPEHGVWEQNPNHHLLGKGCRKCSGSEKLTTAIFVIRANKKHNNKYDYSLVKYTDYYGKVDIICNQHGMFKQGAGSHLSGIGCPKCRRSKGEELIENYLIENQIVFETQKTFAECFFKQKLQFDFYIPKHNMCIEFDGAQHHVPVKHFGGELDLKTRQKRDDIKNNFCQKSGIQLVRIKHNENIVDKLNLLFV